MTRWLKFFSVLLLPWVATRCGGEADSTEDAGGFLSETDMGPDIDQIYREYQDRCVEISFIIAGRSGCGVARHQEQVISEIPCEATFRPSPREMQNPSPKNLRLLEEIRGTNRCLFRVNWFARPFSGEGKDLQCFALVEGTDTAEILNIESDPASPQRECEVL